MSSISTPTSLPAGSPTTLANAEYVNFSYNRLSGSIPANLANNSNLKSLSLRDNQLSGSIPPELGNLSNLWSLNLGTNQLTGHIPSELGNLSSLRRLRLGGNQLTGTIPVELSGLSLLGSLDVGNNQLIGTIPVSLGDLTNLERLDLSENKLSGPIPTALGKLAGLERLYLQGNQLTGPIPPEVAGLSSLLRLRLDNNQLTGTIPDELVNRKGWNELGLHGNVVHYRSSLMLQRFSISLATGSCSSATTIPDAYLELGIGWISRDGSEQVVVSFLRDEQLGTVYIIVRHESDGRIVRRWVPPDSDLIANIPWDAVIRDFSVPTAVVVAVPLDHRFPEPNQLVRYFAKEDDPIFAYDAELQQWRRVPDEATFQDLGFFKCDMTMADVEFFEQIEIGPAYPTE